MTKLKFTNADYMLLKKASAVKFGWLAMDVNGQWFWYNKKPYWNNLGHWGWEINFTIQDVNFLKLPKRSRSFAPRSLIKCTPDGPILVATGNQYHKTWGIISASTVKNIRIIKKGR